MPWETTGTVSIAQYSNAVNGTGTSFITTGRVGDAFRRPDGAWYEVVNIASDSAVSIAPAYQGITVSGGNYALAPMQGYVKESADQLRAIVNGIGSKIADLEATGNDEVLPVAKGGTGRSDARSVFAELGVQAPAALFSAQGLYLGWNGEAGHGGAANFTCNEGGGAGGVTWRSVNADNSVSGPTLVYGYDGTLTVPSAVSTPKITGLTTAISVGQGGTGATGKGLANLGGQSKRASLSALSFDSSSANQVPYFNVASTTALMTVTPFMRTVLDDPTAAIACDMLGLSSGLYSENFYTINAIGPNGGTGTGTGLTACRRAGRVALGKC